MTGTNVMMNIPLWELLYAASASYFNYQAYPVKPKPFGRRGKALRNQCVEVPGYAERPIKRKVFGRRGKPLRNQCVEFPGYAEKIRKAVKEIEQTKSEGPAVFGREHTCPAMIAIMAEAAKDYK
ncbi:hypothetical protein EDC01DRAFT_632884 [Geopyxis carbonaria]|nr:hypothetical protein EDC01DRAFT_632884 [Geopyxis carbonaria]